MVGVDLSGCNHVLHNPKIIAALDHQLPRRTSSGDTAYLAPGYGVSRGEIRRVSEDAPLYRLKRPFSPFPAPGSYQQVFSRFSTRLSTGRKGSLEAWVARRGETADFADCCGFWAGYRPQDCQNWRAQRAQRGHNGARRCFWENPAIQKSLVSLRVNLREPLCSPNPPNAHVPKLPKNRLRGDGDWAILETDKENEQCATHGQ